MSFSFRPLWQQSAAEEAAVALQKAQTTAVYAGLSLWPADVTAALVRSQLLEDGTYPNAEAAFAVGEAAQSDAGQAQAAVADYSPDQPRDDHGRWTEIGGAFSAGPLPGSSVIRAESGFERPSDHPIRVTGGEEPFTGETPEEQEEENEKREWEKERQRINLNTGFKIRPDGSLEPPKLLQLPP